MSTIRRGSGITSFALPQIESMLPIASHPETEEIVLNSDAWVRSHVRHVYRTEEDLERYLEGQIALLCCQMIPTAEKSITQAMCDLFQYIVILDDALGDKTWLGGSIRGAQNVAGRVMAALTGWGLEDNFTKGVRNSADRLRPHMSPQHWKRFVIDFEDMLEGYLIEISARGEDGISDFDAYMCQRRVTVAMKWFLVGVELGNGDVLSEPAATHPQLLDLRDTVLDHLWLVNDLFSFRKERWKDEYISTISVLERIGNRSTQECVSWICSLIAERERAYVEKCSKILSSPLAREPGIETYLDNLAYVMSGPLHWSPTTPRYKIPVQRAL
jgi:Terpene synthase family 2, C-terminal metal binding